MIVRSVRPVLGIGFVLALLAGGLGSSVGAADRTPLSGEVRAAPATPAARDAVRTFAALSAAKDTLDEHDLSALGPNPYLSWTVDRDPTEVVLWRTLAQTIAVRTNDLGTPRGVRYVEREPRGVTGRNDRFRRGERIAGFGTGPLEDDVARVVGAMPRVPAPPSPPVSGSSTEDDGSIPTANPVTLVAETYVRYEGTVGDGDHADTGDFDFWDLGTLAAGQLVVIDTDTSEIFDATDTLVALYAADGTLVDANDDDGLSLDSHLEVPITESGRYYALVTGCCGLPLDPMDPASGEGPVSAGDYAVDFGIDVAPASANRDVDVFLVDLDAGDAISVGVAGSPTTVELIDRRGRVFMGSPQTAAFAYPAASPLRHQGDIGLDHIVDRSGRYAIRLSGGFGGRYQMELRVARAGGSDRGGTDGQILFLDFDGAVVNTVPLGGIDPAAELTGLRGFLFRWGLRQSDEDAIIDQVVATVTENLDRDLSRRGRNGDRDITGRGGQFDIDIRNSRDDPDPGRAPNVTRLVIGGSVAESGVDTVGIAETIDPGNFDRSENAIVLLDFLSAPRGVGGLNDIAVSGGRAVKRRMVGVTIGNVAAHEAGHLLGSWHTDVFNRRVELMDSGGNLPALVGVGPDGRYGTRDDVDVDFGPDRFDPAEGFFGIENPLQRLAFALSTGSGDVAVRCTITGTEGDDVLEGGPGNDVICGLGGNDVLIGKGGRDRLVGGPGDDVLRGGADWDILRGDTGDDRLVGGPGPDDLAGGPGDDIARGGKGRDLCEAERRQACERG